MHNLVATMPAMPATAIAAVSQLTEASRKLPQVEITTEHSLHAGVYARTIKIPAGVLLTGVLIKIPTLLIFNGDAVVYTATGPEQWTGYRVFEAPANRKQAFMACEDTFLTMVFASAATTVEEAEAEFTDELNQLLSRL